MDLSLEEASRFPGLGSYAKEGISTIVREDAGKWRKSAGLSTRVFGDPRFEDSLSSARLPPIPSYTTSVFETLFVILYWGRQKRHFSRDIVKRVKSIFVSRTEPHGEFFFVLMVFSKSVANISKLKCFLWCQWSCHGRYTGYRIVSKRPDQSVVFSRVLCLISLIMTLSWLKVCDTIPGGLLNSFKFYQFLWRTATSSAA